MFNQQIYEIVILNLDLRSFSCKGKKEKKRSIEGNRRLEWTNKEIYTLINIKITLDYILNLLTIYFPRQSLKIFNFRVKLSDSIFFLLGHSPIVKLI